MTLDPTAFDAPVPPGGYAWWYLDALADDGLHALTIIAFVGSVFSPYYAHARRRSGAAAVDPLEHCSINVALYGPTGARWSMTERRATAVTRSATRLAIGPSALEWRDDGLRLVLDEIAAPLPRRIRGTIDVMTGPLVDAGAATIALDARGRHRWTPLAPATRVRVALDAPSLAWNGAAYLDSNAGDVPLEDDFVRWNWSRAHLADGRAAVVYDVERRDATPLAIARWFDRDGGAGSFEAPPVVALPATRWGLHPSTRCDVHAGPDDARPVVAQSFEDGPFYSRALVDSRWFGEPVRSVHEHLSLERFERRWVRALLPFRMPRRFY